MTDHTHGSDDVVRDIVCLRRFGDTLSVQETVHYAGQPMPSTMVLWRRAEARGSAAHPVVEIRDDVGAHSVAADLSLWVPALRGGVYTTAPVPGGLPMPDEVIALGGGRPPMAWSYLPLPRPDGGAAEPYNPTAAFARTASEAWVGTIGGEILMWDGAVWHLQRRGDGRPVSGFFTVGDHLWAGGEAGLATRWTGRGGWRDVPLPGAAEGVGTPVAGTLAPDGRPLLALREGWLLRHDRDGLRIEGAIGNRHIYGLATWRGKTLVSTENGIYAYAGDGVALVKALPTFGMLATGDHVHFLHGGQKPPADRVFISHSADGRWWYARF